MTSNTDAADTLDNAADIIERDGWWDGHRTGDDRPFRSVCAVQAISRAYHERNRSSLVTRFATDLPGFYELAAYIGTDSLPGWNDAQSGPQPILDALRGCAKELRRLEDRGEFEH